MADPREGGLSLDRALISGRARRSGRPL